MRTPNDVREVREDCVRDDSGLTMVEMLVSLLLLSIVVIVAFNVITFASVTTADQSITTAALQRAEGASNDINYDLNAAVNVTSGGSQFTQADANDATFYASLKDANGPVQVVLSVTQVSGQYVLNLVETPANNGSLAAGTFTYGGAADHGPKKPIVNLPVTYGGSTPVLLTYYDINGNVLAPPGTTTANLNQIASVTVSITVPANKKLGNPTTVSTRIYFGHAGYVIGVT